MILYEQTYCSFFRYHVEIKKITAGYINVKSEFREDYSRLESLTPNPASKTPRRNLRAISWPWLRTDPIKAAIDPHANVIIGRKTDGRVRERIMLEFRLSILGMWKIKIQSSHLTWMAPQR